MQTDKRRIMLEKTLKEHDYQESSLLEILHRAQEIYGYLDKDLLADVAAAMNLPPSDVYGVATFYNYFKLRKPGEHIVTGCLGTACYVKGAEQIMAAIEQEFNLKRGGSTVDGKLSLLMTRCIGACAMAPNFIVDDEVISKATPQIVVSKIRQALKEEKPIEAV